MDAKPEGTIGMPLFVRVTTPVHSAFEWRVGEFRRQCDAGFSDLPQSPKDRVDRLWNVLLDSTKPITEYQNDTLREVLDRLYYFVETDFSGQPALEGTTKRIREFLDGVVQSLCDLAVETNKRSDEIILSMDRSLKAVLAGAEQDDIKNKQLDQRIKNARESLASLYLDWGRNLENIYKVARGEERSLQSRLYTGPSLYSCLREAAGEVRGMSRHAGRPDMRTDSLPVAPRRELTIFEQQAQQPWVLPLIPFRI